MRGFGAARWSLARRATVLFALTLAACVPQALERLRETGSPSPPQASFDIAGRLSARHGGDGLAANFRWRRADGRDELELVSPLGQTIARLTGEASHVRLETSDGQTSTASDWSALTTRGLGWPLPVDGLAFWIQGAAREGSPATTELSDDGRVSVLRQDGWTVAYGAYTQNATGTWRPARIMLSYPDIELRIAVDTWQ
jgi:outer membrane lipoprotein LolB